MHFNIIYDGIALQNNEMEIKNLAPALLAISDMIEEANLILNRGNTKVNVTVKGSFKTGCFGINLIVTQDLLDSLFNVFKHKDVVTGAVLLSYIGFTYGITKETTKGVLQIIKWLKNRKITKIVRENDKNKATIYVDEDKLTVELDILTLLENPKIQESMKKAITEPLSKKGIDSFTCKTQDLKNKQDNFVVVKKEEISYFEFPQKKDEVINEQIYETNI